MAVQEPDLQHTDETSTTAVLEHETVATPPAPASSPMVIFENVTKIYEPDVAALRDVSFAIDKGEFVFVVGACCMVRGSPCICITHTPQSPCATTSSAPGVAS